MTVRSTRLGEWYSGATPDSAVLYTCPAGWRTIVKSVGWTSEQSAASRLQCYISGTKIPYLVLFDQTVTNGTFGEVSLWQVINAGESVVSYAAAPSLALWVSGTLLQLTGQEPL